MHVLVTGSAGFIGSTLVDRLLNDGHRVDGVDNLSTGSRSNLYLALDHSAFSFHELDIRDQQFFDLVIERKPEVIFHLAAQSSVAVSVEEPLADAEVNIIGSLQVLNAARSARVRKVAFAASGGTLYAGAKVEDLPLDESYEQGPSSPYGISKRAVVDYLRAYRSLYGLEFTALALANVYGPRQDPWGEAGVVAVFAENIAAGKESTINGDGEQTRDFVYVDDVVHAFVCAGTKGDGELLNIGSGIETSVNDLYAAMVETYGDAQPPRHGKARDGEVRFSALNPARAYEQLGWQPQVSLQNGTRNVLTAAVRRQGKDENQLIEQSGQEVAMTSHRRFE